MVKEISYRFKQVEFQIEKRIGWFFINGAKQDSFQEHLKNKEKVLNQLKEKRKIN